MHQVLCLCLGGKEERWTLPRTYWSIERSTRKECGPCSLLHEDTFSFSLRSFGGMAVSAVIFLSKIQFSSSPSPKDSSAAICEMIPRKRRSDNDNSESALKIAAPVEVDSHCPRDSIVSPNAFGKKQRKLSSIGTNRVRNTSSKSKPSFLSSVAQHSISSFPSNRWMSDATLTGVARSRHQGVGSRHNQQWPRRVSSNELVPETNSNDESNHANQQESCSSQRHHHLKRSLALDDSLFTMDSSGKDD